MNIKLIGAAMIVAGCGGVGFSMAAAYRREEKALGQMVAALDYMGCELQYHRLPLPELCRRVAGETGGVVGRVMDELAGELENQVAPDAAACMTAALTKTSNLPRRLEKILRELGTSLGQFDLPGQLQGLEGAREACRRELEELSRDREPRLRSYQTLGLCAGCALAILFL